MTDYDKVTDIFCITDEFCKNFDQTSNFILGKPSKRPPKMAKSEVMCIVMLFHLSGFRCFKHFYLFYVQRPTCKTSSPRPFPTTGLWSLAKVWYCP